MAINTLIKEIELYKIKTSY